MYIYILLYIYIFIYKYKVYNNIYNEAMIITGVWHGTVP